MGFCFNSITIAVLLLLLLFSISAQESEVENERTESDGSKDLGRRSKTLQKPLIDSKRKQTNGAASYAEKNLFSTPKIMEERRNRRDRGNDEEKSKRS